MFTTAYCFSKLDISMDREGFVTKFRHAPSRCERHNREGNVPGVRIGNCTYGVLSGIRGRLS